MTGRLTDEQKAMLALEAEAIPQAGIKDSEIRRRFGLTPITYYARLNRLIDTEAAQAHDGALVNRLRRLREVGLRRKNVRRM